MEYIFQNQTCRQEGMKDLRVSPNSREVVCSVHFLLRIFYETLLLTLYNVSSFSEWRPVHKLVNKQMLDSKMYNFLMSGKCILFDIIKHEFEYIPLRLPHADNKRSVPQSDSFMGPPGYQVGIKS